MSEAKAAVDKHDAIIVKEFFNNSRKTKSEKKNTLKSEKVSGRFVTM